MMEQCSKCKFYDKHYDDREQLHNDLGSDTDHFCIMFTDSIDPKIVNDEAECEFFTDQK